MCALVPRIAVILLVLALGGCGDAPATPPSNAPPAAPMELVCPVEGTHFPPGEGVGVTLDGRTVELCSQGCAIRFEMEPEAYPEKTR